MNGHDDKLARTEDDVRSALRDLEQYAPARDRVLRALGQPGTRRRPRRPRRARLLAGTPGGRAGAGWPGGPRWRRWAAPAAAALALLVVAAALALTAGTRGHHGMPRGGSAPSSPPGLGTPHRNNGGLFFWTHFNRVNGLAALSAHDIWAVGSAATGKPLIERWNGMAWKQVPSASPRDAKESLLNSVAATGSSSAWAVGYYNNGSAIKTLIERWNGRAWTQVTSPSPGGVHGSFLAGVAATGPSSAWAVGYYNNGSAIKTLIERWNGRAWAQVTSPSPGGSHAWSALSGVAAAGTSSAWAVGYYGRPIRPLIERWNGRAWTYVASPNPGGRDGGALDAVATAGRSGAWAAGNVGTRTVDEALIERWNGRAWRQVTSPRPTGSRGSTLTAIAAGPAASAWAVGYYYADTDVEPAVLTLIERWNGRAWTQVTSPSPGGSAEHLPDQSLLQAVCTISPSDAWSAGSYSSGNPLGKILIERWTGRTWTQLPAGR